MSEVGIFWEKVALVGNACECWLWKGVLSHNGYGRFSIGRGKKAQAHRWAYESIIGPIPDGLHLDHLCRVRSCVNPYHLEPVTNRENILRGEGPTAVNSRAKECPKGHPYSGENLIVQHGTGRLCRECKNSANRDRRQAEEYKAYRRAYMRAWRANHNNEAA